MINFCPSCGHPFPSIDLECLLFLIMVLCTTTRGFQKHKELSWRVDYLEETTSHYSNEWTRWKVFTSIAPCFFSLYLFCAQPTNHIRSAIVSLQCWTTAARVLVVQIEIKSQQLCELLKQQHELASIHNKKRLLLHFGWCPWLRLLLANRWRLHWASETLAWSVSLV
jgi:hypothetical protein